MSRRACHCTIASWLGKGFRGDISGGIFSIINIDFCKNILSWSGQGHQQESELRVAIRTELERTGSGGEEIAEEIHSYYKRQFSENINKLRIRVEFLATNTTTTVYSQEIRSTKLSPLDPVNFQKPNILKSCTNGSRRILLVSKVE